MVENNGGNGIFDIQELEWDLEENWDMILDCLATVQYDEQGFEDIMLFCVYRQLADT